MRSDNAPNVQRLETEEILDLLESQVREPKRRNLQNLLVQLIDSGELVPGTRLPTAREVAQTLGVSIASVGQVWAELGSAGFTEAKTRKGTIVLGPARRPFTLRHRDAAGSFGANHLPLYDESLLPAPLEPAAPRHLGLKSRAYYQVHLHPSLEEVHATHADRSHVGVLATLGWLDAVELLVRSTTTRGDYVAVESPTAPRLLDILETAGVRAIPVPWEGSGPSIERLGTAVRRGAKLFIYQPTLQVPTGRTVSEEWVANAAAVLTTNNVLAVEVEASLFASARASTLVDIAGFRESVVHIEDHSLAYGNDLRIATLTASNRVAKLVAKGLTLSERWVPPTMQLQLANHLTDSRSLYSVELAAREYERRNTAVVETLRAGGVTVESSGGMKAWLAVHDEDQSIKAIELSRLGLAHFHRGSAFKLLQGRQQHLSLHTADLLKHTEALADVLRETNDAGIARSSAMRNSQTANSRGERQAGELRVNERLA